MSERLKSRLLAGLEGRIDDNLFRVIRDFWDDFSPVPEDFYGEFPDASPNMTRSMHVRMIAIIEGRRLGLLAKLERDDGSAELIFPDLGAVN